MTDPTPTTTACQHPPARSAEQEFPMTDPTPAALRDRLRLHAYDLVNGGTNATDLRNDLNAAAALLQAAEARETALRADLAAAERAQTAIREALRTIVDDAAGGNHEAFWIVHKEFIIEGVAALRTADAPPAPRLVTADDPLCPGDCIGNYADGVHGGRYPCEHNPNRAAVLRVHPDAETHDEDTAPAPAEGGAPPRSWTGFNPRRIQEIGLKVEKADFWVRDAVTNEVRLMTDEEWNSVMGE